MVIVREKVTLSSFDYWCLCSYLPKNYSTQCDQMAIVFSIFWHSNHRKFAQLHTFAKAGTKVCQLPNQKHTKKSQRLLKFAKATKFRQIWSHWQGARTYYCHQHDHCAKTAFLLLLKFCKKLQSSKMVKFK